MDAVSNAADSQSTLETSKITRSPGPLFKDLYAGLIDVEDPQQWKPVIESQSRSFFANTTDISSLEQFKVIHSTPEKWGTAFHHKAYVSAIEYLSD